MPSTLDSNLIKGQFVDSEVVIGLVGAVGSDLGKVTKTLEDRLKVFKYRVKQVRISSEIIPQFVSDQQCYDNECERINGMMDAGNKVREQSQDSAILALGAASEIAAFRKKENNDSPRNKPRYAYIINSLKHPEEIIRLREIYPKGFYLIGVYSDHERRVTYLTKEKQIGKDDVDKLIQRDADEFQSYGQKVTDTFHMSDFFVRLDGNEDYLKNSIWRILDIMFGSPYKTPTFDEFAMFLAFSASLRSADLSRQVGAVIAKNQEVLATGANDCPRSGGGLYWPELDPTTKDVEDHPKGRDYTRGQDSNKAEQHKIINEIIESAGGCCSDETRLREVLEKSSIRDLTEYGRVVHAEMEALLCCARNGLCVRSSTLYCTTFPCHNCAKHIVAAGVSRVVYIEPYQKSKAMELHDDSISLGLAAQDDRVRFEPFVGIGPRRFFDMFSLRLGAGHKLSRKNSDGSIIKWKQEQSFLRMQMLPCSYLELEVLASNLFNKAKKKIKGEPQDVQEE